MSKVIYKRTDLPKKEGIYFVLADGEKQIMEFRNGEWAYPVYCWYSETPPPELADVLEKIKANINNNKEYSNYIRIPIQYAETLLNELLN